MWSAKPLQKRCSKKASELAQQKPRSVYRTVRAPDLICTVLEGLTHGSAVCASNIGG